MLSSVYKPPLFILNQNFQQTNCVTSSNTILTGEVDGKTRLGDVEVSLKLDGDDIESGVYSLRQERAADLLQRHLVVRRTVPHLQDIVGRLCVKGKKLETTAEEQRRSRSDNIDRINNNYSCKNDFFDRLLYKLNLFLYLFNSRLL